MIEAGAHVPEMPDCISAAVWYSTRRSGIQHGALRVVSDPFLFLKSARDEAKVCFHRAGPRGTRGIGPYAWHDSKLAHHACFGAGGLENTLQNGKKTIVAAPKPIKRSRNCANPSQSSQDNRNAAME